MRLSLLAVLAVLAAPVAAAQNWYVSGAGGVSFQFESDNEGEIDDFETPGALVLDEGDAVLLETQFRPGFSFSFEAGRSNPSGVRFGVEVSFARNEVDELSGLFLGGVGVDPSPAAEVFGADAPDASVGELLASGSGEVNTLFVFANAYYDFDFGRRATPYLGLGVGFARVEVDFDAAGVSLVQDVGAAVAYQGKAGATYRLTDRIDLFSEAAFRFTPGPISEVEPFPAEIEVETSQVVLSTGLRWLF